MEYYCYVSSNRSSKQALTVLTSFLLSCHRAPKDKSYSSMLRVPSEGLELKTRIYVEVKASNLTDKYATPTVARIHSLFFGFFCKCFTSVFQCFNTHWGNI